LRAFNQLAIEKSVKIPMLSKILESNEEHIHRAMEKISSYGTKEIGILGLSFKHGTDDLRESPSVKLSEKLLGKGYKLLIYDEWVDAARLVGSNKYYIENEIPHLNNHLKSELNEVVENSALIILIHASKETINSLLTNKNKLIILDLSGNRQLAKSSNIEYQGFCW
jgi:GDP-mannose 6-dehydrogenase